MTAAQIVDLLLEAPVTAFNTIGDFNKGGSYRHAVDRKLVASPVVAQKVKQKFAANLDAEFDLYFVNGNARALKPFEERGEVRKEVLYAKPPEGLGLTPEQVPLHPDHITVIYVSNSATPHEPMTPWIIAHRFAHAIRQTHQYQEYMKQMKSVLRDIAGDALPPKADMYGYSSNGEARYKAYRERETAKRLIAQQVGSMRSARTGQLRDEGEFYHEVFAQFLMTGKVTFRPTNGKLTVGHKWGKPVVRPSVEGSDHSLKMAERDIAYYCDDVIGSLMNKIFVM